MGELGGLSSIFNIYIYFYLFLPVTPYTPTVKFDKLKTYTGLSSLKKETGVKLPQTPECIINCAPIKIAPIAASSAI